MIIHSSVNQERENIKMVSSRVSYMLVSLLLLLLVFPDMDNALGEQIHLRNRKLKETEHHDHVKIDQSLAGFPRIWVPKPPQINCNAVCLKRWKKAHDLLNAIPRPPPPPSRFSKGKHT